MRIRRLFFAVIAVAIGTALAFVVGDALGYQPCVHGTRLGQAVYMAIVVGGAFLGGMIFEDRP